MKEFKKYKSKQEVLDKLDKAKKDLETAGKIHARDLQRYIKKLERILYLRDRYFQKKAI